MLNQVFEFINNTKSFYNMNWYGFEIGHYMTYISLGGMSWLGLDVYLKTRKGKNDIRRLLVDEQRRK